LDDGGEKEEEDAPCEAYPEGEEGDDGLCEQHFGGPHKGDFEHLEYRRFGQFGLCVDFTATGFAEVLGAPSEDHVTPGLAENHVEDGDEGGVVNDLDVEDPAFSC
jgi:hypothetical protein